MAESKLSCASRAKYIKPASPVFRRSSHRQRSPAISKRRKRLHRFHTRRRESPTGKRPAGGCAAPGSSLRDCGKVFRRDCRGTRSARTAPSWRVPRSSCGPLRSRTIPIRLISLLPCDRILDSFVTFSRCFDDILTFQFIFSLLSSFHLIHEVYVYDIENGNPRLVVYFSLIRCVSIFSFVCFSLFQCFRQTSFTELYRKKFLRCVSRECTEMEYRGGGAWRGWTACAGIRNESNKYL